MRSHRLAVIVISLASTVLAAGCSAGRDTPTFGAGATPSAGAGVQAAPVTDVPPVIVSAPDAQALRERDAAAADATHSREIAAQARARRNAARHELRKERTKAARAHRRAAARERRLRAALGGALAPRRSTPAPSPPVSGHSAPIAASDVGGTDLAAERDRRSDTEARASVVRFHELLDQRDAHSCMLLTPRFLHVLYGAEDDAGSRCAEATRSIGAAVSVVIADSRAHGRRASVAVISRMGDAEVAQTLHLLLVDGTWLIDAVERQPAS
jgi:hypothetical protein